jgi:hypothetical protein
MKDITETIVLYSTYSALIIVPITEFAIDWPALVLAILVIKESTALKFSLFALTIVQIMECVTLWQGLVLVMLDIMALTVLNST